jgi:hypothetical protein
MSLKRAFSRFRIFRKRKYEEADKDLEGVIEDNETNRYSNDT